MSDLNVHLADFKLKLLYRIQIYDNMIYKPKLYDYPNKLKYILFTPSLGFRDFEYVLYKKSLCSHHSLVFLFLLSCFVFGLFTLLMILPRPFDNLSYGNRGDTCVVIVLRFKGVKVWKILREKNKLTQSFRNTLGKHLQCTRFVRVALL